MHAAPKADVPLADVHDITQYDGFIFGFPTRCALTHRERHTALRLSLALRLRYLAPTGAAVVGIVSCYAC